MGTCDPKRSRLEISTGKGIGNGKTLGIFSRGFFYAHSGPTPQRVTRGRSVWMLQKVGRLVSRGKSVRNFEKVGGEYG